MALKDIVIQTKKIVYREGDFTVHGINLDTITTLMVQGHRKDIDKAIDEIRSAAGENFEGVDEATLIGALSTVVAELPALVAKVIALSAGEPDMADTVRKLPVGVQLDAIIAIGKLTFDGEDSVKKFVASLIETVVAMRKTATPAVQAATEVLAGMKA